MIKKNDIKEKKWKYEVEEDEKNKGRMLRL